MPCTVNTTLDNVSSCGSPTADATVLHKLPQTRLLSRCLSFVAVGRLVVLGSAAGVNMCAL